MPPLSDIAIRRAKPAPKTQKLFDGGGLYLEISPAGGRWWRLKYRFAGKEKRLALGVYPEVPLALARTRREDARRLLAQGIDPSQQRKADASAQQGLAANTFEAVAREWLKGRIWAPSYQVKVAAWFENDIFPWIGSRPAGALTAPDFLALARRMENRGAIESGHRVIQNCSQVMRYAIATGRADRNPVADLRGALRPKPQRHYAAVTDPTSLGKLLAAIDGYTGSHITRCALLLAPLVFVRPGELRQAEWSEIDQQAAQWLIPADKMKMRQQHMVPLSRQALAILDDLRPLTGDGQFVFAGRLSPKRPMSENTVNAALRRVGYESDMMTGHGFRAAARTILDEVLGFRPDIIEHQLAHAVRDPNGRAYNRTSHLDERVRMMQRWADYLDELRERATGRNIRQIA
ncbi:tyrosine-type recombinase/integrase [Xanthomonas euvesicatoria]